MKAFILLIFSILYQSFFCQAFLNGDFEHNSASGDQINMSNDDCNQKIRDLHSFGTYGDVDIIRSSTYGSSGAQNGTWYLGLTGGGTDIVALSLSGPLLTGKVYSISYYDRKTSGYAVSPIQIGLSTKNNDFGTVIYKASGLAELNVWAKHTFTFAAPNDGKFITVQMQSGGIQDWINVDNFVFNNTRCNSSLSITSSALTIDQGQSVTLTANGSTDYTWSNSETLNSLNENTVIATPLANTIYTVSSKHKDCGILTATVAVNVNQPVVKKQIDTLIAETIVEKKDPPHKKHKTFFNTHRIHGRKFIIQESLTVSNASVKLMVWDKNKADGDEVSLYLNGELIIEKFIVSKTKKEIIIDLEPGKNIIVMHALNLGSIPPNTAALSINDGSKRAKLITLVSTLKKSGALEVFYDPLAYNNK
jgi:hypothetical protein